MFEAQVSFYLNRYLGRFVEGIDSNSLRISIYQGNVVLRNLRLKPDALADLDLPVTVTAGLLGSLTLKVPWSALGRVPVEVTIDRLYLIATPKADGGSTGGVQDPDDIAAAYQRAKLARVERQEKEWVEELQQLQERRGKGGDGGDALPSAPGGGGGGMLKAVIDTVLGNLQLSITNVHVRYEDGVTNPGRPFAVGWTLERIAGRTVDEAGREAFVTNSPLDILRKALDLCRMSVYFDCDATFWSPDAAWRDMPPVEWDDWFQPGISALRQERGGTARGREYVLSPVDGRALYTRRGRGVRRAEGQAAMEIDFSLDVIQLQLTQLQYQSYQLLLAEVSLYAARVGHNAYRPRLRPAAGRPARIWWRYAAQAIMQQRLAHRLSWRQAVRFVLLRKQYVPLYVAHLRALAANPKEPMGTELRSLDAQLPEVTILMFRRLAHAEAQRERRREARAALAAGGSSKQGGGGGWGSWLASFAGGGQPAGAPQSALAAAAAEEPRGDLTPEEFSKLIELVSEQEEGLRLGTETPFTLLTKVTAKVGSASAVLMGVDGTAILRGGLDGISADIAKYPATLKVFLGVTAMGVESPQGTFIRTGAELLSLPEGGAGAPVAQPSVARALEVTWVQQPQDGSADADLDVVLAPSYVHYSASTVERVAAFFRTPQALDFSGLAVQASSQLDRARRLASEYAAAALRSRPKLKLRLDLNAPKIALPVEDAHGQVTLVLDLGRFVIQSDPGTAARLPQDEAALYECMQLEGKDVAIYLVDGHFDWEAGGRKGLQGGDASAAGSGAGAMVPLLEQCGMDIALQAARFPDPRFPMVKLQPSVPKLRFFISPARIGRLLRVLKTVVPDSGEDGAAGAEAEWMQRADQKGYLRTLTWEGLGRSTGRWCRRYAVVYMGQLYLYEDEHASKAADSVTIWTKRSVVKVPADAIGGAEHVVALCTEGEDPARMLEDSSTVLLRLEDAQQADVWYRKLLSAQQAMKELAGEAPTPALPSEWDDGSSALSASDAEEAMAAAQMPTPARQQDLQEQARPSVVVQLNAQLGELAIFASGRAPDVWWPAEEAISPTSAAREAAADAGQGFPVFVPDGVVNMDGEVALIVFRASGGTCELTYGLPGMKIHTSLGALEVEDLLVGPKCPQHRYLASSRLPGVSPAEAGAGEDVFFDAEESATALGSRSMSLSSTGGGPSASASESGQSPLSKDLADFTFQIRRPDSPDYEGVDSSLDISLSSLYFFCNRPTVASLMSLGTDIAAAAAIASSTAASAAGTGDNEEASACAVREQPPADQPSGVETATAVEQGVVQGAAQDEDLPPLQLPSGQSGGRHTVFRMTAEMRTLQVVFNYEGEGDHTLTRASMDAFTFGLDISSDSTLSIASSLGNIQAVDCTLLADHPYHQACGLRDGGGTSLISIDFASHLPLDQPGRVPAGMPHYSLRADLSELQLTFLYRFLQENLHYIAVMLAMRPPPKLQPPPGAAQQAPGQEQPRGPPPPALEPFVLLLDVHANAPVICMPRDTGSMDSIVLDLGQLTLSNRVILQPGRRGAREVPAEVANLTFTGVECNVLVDGVRGKNIIENDDQGWNLAWRRPLQPELRGNVPMFDLSLSIASLKASLTDTEYLLMTSIAGANVSELPQLPGGAGWLAEHYQPFLDLQQQQQQQFEEAGDLVPASQEEQPGQPSTLKDDSQTKVRVVVALALAELELWRHLDGLPDPQPLARFTVGGTFVSFRNNEAGGMAVSVCLPRVEAQDLRPEVPPEQSLVISSGHKASFLMLDWSGTAELEQQSLSVTLQKPLFVVELSFLLAITKFVVPTFSYVRNSPTPFVTHDILLTGSPHLGEGDLWLSPAVRIVADQPGVTSFEYDGRGGRIMLPAKAQLNGPLPLILVGSGKTLILKNVTVVNSASLATCLQLMPGSRLVAEPNDDVMLLESYEELPEEAAAPGSPVSPRVLPSSRKLTQPSPSRAGAAPPQQRTMEIAVSAVGLGLQFMQLGSSAGSGNTSRSASAALVRPGSSLGIGSRHTSTDDVPMLAAQQKQAGAAAASPRSVQLLAANMDVDVAYKTDGSAQSGEVVVQGLRMETRFIQDAASQLRSREEQDIASKRKLRGRSEGTVLDPCRLSLEFALRSQVGGIPSLTDIKLLATDLRLNLSPDVIELGTALFDSALQPLMQPKADAAVTSCAKFERLWSVDPSMLLKEENQLAVSLGISGAEGGITVWRPQVPGGYGVLGDVVTPGTSQPTFEVVAVAVNSGLVAYPTGYLQIWSAAGGTIWRPVPPKHYVAAGDILTLDDSPPELSAMLCLHEATVMEAPLGQCLVLPPQLPHTPAATAQVATSLPPLDIWCIDNSLGTFIAATSKFPSTGLAFDLRNPVGLTPAALVEMGAAQYMQATGSSDGRPTPSRLSAPLDSRELFQRFTASSTEAKTEDVQRTLTPTVVDFHRVWTDGGKVTNGEGISIWRPVAPPGYASMGDCLVRGFDPPLSAVVVQESNSTQGLGQAGLPLVRPPRGMELVWQDTSYREEGRLCFWMPVPHPGYVSLGCVATIGVQPPGRGAAKCLRADAACAASFGRAPFWALRPEEKTFPPMSAWLTDERANTFIVVPSRRGGPPADCWRLKPLDQQQQPSGGVYGTQAQASGVNVVVQTGRTTVLLRNTLRVPLLEIELGAIDAGIRGPSQQVVQGYLGFQFGACSYNSTIRHWEPVVEPCDIIAKCDANFSSKVASGIEPGMHISIKSSTELIRTTLAVNALQSVLAALADWRSLQTRHGHEGFRRLLATSDSSTVEVTMENTLGVEAAMELDFGNHLEAVTLPAGSEMSMLKPMPLYPMRQSTPLQPGSMPHDLLLVDIKDAAVGAAAAQGQQLFCTLRLSKPAGAVKTAIRTRGLSVDDSGVVPWHERMILSLPVSSEPQSMIVEVWDAAANGGRGRVLASGTIAVPVKELKHREEHAADMELTSASGKAMQLHASYMLQNQWTKLSATPVDSWSAEESTSGQRALSISTNPGTWVVVPPFGQQKSGGRNSGAVTSLAPLKIGNEGVVLEGRLLHGVLHERLRSLGQVVNSTGFTLEACLVVVEDEDWQMVAVSGGAALQAGAVEEEVFESERWVSLKGWTANNLRPEDPGHFQHRGNAYEAFPDVPAPVGWSWDGGWDLDRSGGLLEKEGWVYGPDFESVGFPPRPEANKASPADTVRRRRWVRHRRRAGGASGSQAAKGVPAAPGRVVRERQVLGLAQPGETIPLPLNWNHTGKQIQLRPVLGPAGVAVHDWSVGASQGSQTLELDSLDEGITRLVACSPLQADGGENPLEASILWFSVMVESEILAGAQQGEPLVDWRIVASAPLEIVNQLPVPGSLLVWEQQKGSQQLVDRQTMQVGSGDRVAIHTADMRRQVSFTFYPEGYDWVESTPSLLSEGLDGGARRAQPLPDRFRLVRPGSTIPVDVFIQRDIEWGSWLLGAREELNPGEVVAMGVPIVATLLAPLWIVNATSLAIDAAVVQVPPPPPAPKGGLPRETTVDQMGSGQRLQRIVTDDSDPSTRSSHAGRYIAPSSMELLSYPLPGFMQQHSASQEARQRERQQHYGVRLRVAGSGWTPPLALDVSNVGAAAAGGQASQMDTTRPVLIQAVVREFGVVHEILARLEVTSYRSSQVLRLEPHVVVSNWTAVPVQLMQCRAAPAPAPTPSAGPSTRGGAPGAMAASRGVLLPEGGRSFSQSTRGIGALPVAPGSARMVRPAMGGEAPAGAGMDLGTVVEMSQGSRASSRWLRIPSVLPACPLVQLSAASQRAVQDRGQVLALPAGATAVPLHLPMGLASHVLCFHSGDAAAAPALWSRPVSVRYPEEQQYHLLMPVSEGGDAAHLTAGGDAGGGGAGSVAILRVSVQIRGIGGLHVTLETVHSEPPFLLENRSPFPLQYRQAHAWEAAFHTLPPFSGVGYLWEHTVQQGGPYELEVQEGAAVGASELYALDAPDGEGGEHAGAPGRARALPLSAFPGLCTVRVGYYEVAALSATQLARVGGDGSSGVLGRGGIDRVLQIVPGQDPLLVKGVASGGGAGSDVHLALEIPGLEASLIDRTPEEVLVLTVSSLRLAATSGSNPTGPYRALRLSVQRLQLDDQLPGTRFPVVLAPVLGSDSPLPMLGVTFVSQVGARGRSFFPIIALRWPHAVQIALSEPLIWRVAEMVQQLQPRGEEEEEEGPNATAAADIPLRIRLLSVSSLATQMSFQGDPLSRPRHISGGVVSMVIDLANFQAAGITLRGFDMPNVSMLRSAFIAHIAQFVQGQLFSVALSLVRNFGVIGGASRVLGILSAGVAKLAAPVAAPGAGPSSMQVARPRTITDVGDGLLEGVGAIGSSFMRGFRGLVEKPLQGAAQGGVEGAMKGVAKGLLGAVANPVSGVLDALSATAEGFDATFSRPRSDSLVLTRRRLPRVVGAEGRVLPLVRDGSERQAVIEQLGQALLRNSLLAAPEAFMKRRQGAAAEAYEEHFVLPDDRVVLLTSRGLVLVVAPGFSSLDGAAEIGAVTASEVQPGMLEWAVRWDDVLALELRWSRADLQYPDRLVLHRKGVGVLEVLGEGAATGEGLAHQLRCFPGTPQASQVKLVVQKVQRKHYLDPLRSGRLWSQRRRAAAAALPTDVPPPALPLTLLAMDWELAWHTNPARSPVISFWHPVAPAGYKPVGDVVVLGLEPPVAPVLCFRADVALAAAGAPGMVPGAEAAELPPTAPPKEFSLIWRFNGRRPVTVWMPVAPAGYVALGAAVLGMADAPQPEDYLCLRADLTAESRVFNSAIWVWDPAAFAAPGGRPLPQTHLPESWRVSVWQVDSRLGCFLAVRGLTPPPPAMARTVLAVEAKAAAARGGGGGVR